MSTSINQSFTKAFEAEVHTAYQRTGSKLRNTVRFKNNVKGSSTTFQKVGKGTANTKTRNGLVPVMSIDHSPVECTLTDYYAGDWLDSLDEMKIGYDERSVIVNAGAYALGRKTDDLIINALKTATNTVGDGTAGLSKSLILQAFASLNEKDVPDDGQRFGLVGANEWNALLNLAEFSDSDYVGDEFPWLKGTESRKWLGIVWIMHTGLPLTSGVRSCFIYHKTAIGHACGQDVVTDISWHGDYAAYFINNMMSQGACLIDNNGVVKINVDADAAIS
jgi:hypothetical protein